jgi:hypothetical protein
MSTTAQLLVIPISTTAHALMNTLPTFDVICKPVIAGATSIIIDTEFIVVLADTEVTSTSVFASNSADPRSIEIAFPVKNTATAISIPSSPNDILMNFHLHLY